MTDIKTIPLGHVNAFLLNSCVLVDTGTKGSGEKILSFLAENSIKPSDIKLIIVTHAHNDHIGSVKHIKAVTGAKVMMHDAEYRYLTSENPDTDSMIVVSDRDRKRVLSDDSYKFETDIIVHDKCDLSEYGVDAKVYSTPGHSQGSISILFSDGNAIIGDSLMAFIPFLPPHKPIIYYDLKLIKRGIYDLMDKGAKRFYLSHGKAYDKETIIKTLDRVVR